MAFHPFRINSKVRRARKELERDASIRRHRRRGRKRRRRTKKSNSFLR